MKTLQRMWQFLLSLFKKSKDHSVKELRLANYAPVKQQPFVRGYKKIHRNDTCTCGSGKKYKHCCL